MGKAYLAMCECGYSPRFLLVGGNPADPEACFKPMRCQHCRVIISVGLSDQKLGCDQCGGELHDYDIFAANPPCPACDHGILRISFAADWSVDPVASDDGGGGEGIEPPDAIKER